jgi:HPt (histidine-containing phosphotransfer) domain-containing protein
MDINMPNMNGMKATKIIRDEIDKDIPIIALTANVLEGDKEKFIDIGMNDYLSKPLNQKNLTEILLKYSDIITEDTPNITDNDVVKSDEDVTYESILAVIKEEFSNFNEAIITKLVTTFIKSTDESLKELKTAIDEKEYKNLKDISHKIAGASGNLRINQMYEACKRIEKDAAKEIDRDYSGDFNIITNNFEKLKSEVE